MIRIPFRRRLGVVAVAALAAGAIFFGAAGDGWSAAKRAKPTPAPSTAAAPPNAPAPSTDSNGVQAPDVQARQVIAMDFDTGTVLYEKNADQRMTPSSMSKMMTTYLVFKALKDG